MARLKQLSSRLQTLAPRTLPVASASPERIRGRQGMAIRAAFLQAHPLCRECEQRDRVRAALIVDHIVPLALGGADTDANKQSLCLACNREKTARDQAEITARRGGEG